MNVLGLCSGIGGIELGVHRAVPNSRTVCYVEREAYVAAVLAARMEDGSLDPAPIWSDLTTFNGTWWRGAVDLVTAGFPCQPVSLAGKGRAQSDARWLWDEVARAVRDVGPRYVFVENVPGLANRGLSIVLGSLADLGFDAEWGSFSASGSGAPHLRKRLFLLAYANSERAPQPQGCEPNQRRRVSNCGEALANPESKRRRKGRPQPTRKQRGPSATGSSSAVGNANSSRPQDGQEQHHTQQSPALGAGWWASEPGVGRVVDGVPNRVDRIRALGNAVVPAVASRALLALSARAGVTL